MQRIFRFALLALIALPIACDDDDDDGPTQPQQQVAQLRIVNAADIADVQVRRVGSTAPLAEDLDFRGVTQSCVEVPAGEQALVFSTGGVELDISAATFEADKSYTAFLVAAGSTRRAVIVPDDETASDGNNALRFINATSTAGDVYVTPPGGDPGAAFLVAGNLGPLARDNSLPGYAHRATDHTQVRLFAPGATTGNPRADFALAGLPASRLATVVFTADGFPAGPTAFLVTPCE